MPNDINQVFSTPSHDSVAEAVVSKALNVKHWSTDGHGNYWATSPIVEGNQIAPGLYSFVPTNSGIIITRLPPRTDELLVIPGTPMQDVITQIDTFWSSDEVFKRLGLLKKRGFLFEGYPGVGKSSLIALIVEDFVKKHNGLVFYLTEGNVATAGLSLVRKVERNRPIMCIVEDLESAIAYTNGGEKVWLALLDGETQIDNVVYLCTTNKPHEITSRIRDRPSRIDTIIKIVQPNEEARAYYLKSKFPALSEEILSDYVSRTEGLSFAHIREIIVGKEAFGIPIEITLERFNQVNDNQGEYIRSPNQGQFGFRT